MIRLLSLAASASLALAVPAMAESTANFDASKSKAFGAGLTKAADARQAQMQLARQGYSQISDLNRDASGRWVGTAQKDGKTVYVAVAMPHVQPSQK